MGEREKERKKKKRERKKAWEGRRNYSPRIGIKKMKLLVHFGRMD